jgi:tetratricopeptide (TPR) repeat protein
LDAGQWDRAIDYLDEAIRQSPGSAEGHLLRGRALSKKGDQSTAIPDFEQAVALGLKQEAIPLLAQAYFLAGQFSDARTAASDWIELDPNANAFLVRGRSRLAMSDAGGALTDLERASELDSQLHQALLYQGVAHLRLEQFEQAETCLTQSIAAHSNNPRGFWMRAMAREKLGKTIEAEADRATAKELDPAFRLTKSDGESLLRSAIERDTDLSPIERLNPTR